MNRVSPPSAPSVNHLLVLVQSRSIMASKVYHKTSLMMVSKCVSKLARWRTPSPYDHVLKVDLHTLLITILDCISQFTWSWPRSISQNILNYLLQVHPQTRMIMVSEWISEFTRPSFSGAPWIALKHRLQAVQICHVYMGSYLDT